MSKDTGNNITLKAAEDLLHFLYGPDLHGCPTTPDKIVPFIQQSCSTAAQVNAQVNDVLVTVLQGIKDISTPPKADDVADPTRLIKVMTERCDSILEISSNALNMIENIKGQALPEV
ncbi:MAG: hypothetical protein SGI71_01805 [Verrucomicrobiota bacterium]|nr:hypothetical protein [Verrucomicrobiota bacterium]